MKPRNLIKWVPALFLGMCLAGTAMADPKNNPYDDPKKDGYNIIDDARPRFDGEDYPYFQEMYEGKSIKPQEEGTYQDFPSKSVPVRFTLGKVKQVYEPIVPLVEREIKPLNPTEKTPASLARGKVLYNTYCTVCHGTAGVADTPVAKKAVGILAIPPSIAPLIMAFSETHLYNKIRYGSYYNTGSYQPAPGLMPSYGMQTSIQDRWDMVNYMKSPNFGKEGN